MLLGLDSADPAEETPDLKKIETKRSKFQLTTTNYGGLGPIW